MSLVRILSLVGTFTYFRIFALLNLSRCHGIYIHGIHARSFSPEKLFIPAFKNPPRNDAEAIVNLPSDAIQIYLGSESKLLPCRPAPLPPSSISTRELFSELSHLICPSPGRRCRYFRRTSVPGRSYKPRFYKTRPQIHDFGSRECRDITAAANESLVATTARPHRNAIKITFVDCSSSSTPSRCHSRVMRERFCPPTTRPILAGRRTDGWTVGQSDGALPLSTLGRLERC